MLDKLSPRHLRVFIAVYECGGVGRAGQRLLRVPSAIARSVREIESALSAPLFDRTATGMSPTARGDAVYQRAKVVESEFSAAQRALVEHGVSANAPLFSMMVTTRQIQALVKLRELGHMPSVAEALKVSQPAISSALRQVERSLDAVLFTRGRRGMSVNKIGDLLIFRLRRVLSEIERLQEDVLQLQGAIAGRLMISVLPSSKTWLIPTAIASFVGKYPNVQITVVDAPFEALFAGLQAGEIDFIYTGIGPEYKHRDLLVHVVSQERLVVVARADHPLVRKKKRVAAADLGRYPWVLRDPSAPSRQLLNSVFAGIGLKSPCVAVQAGDLGLLRGLLMQSDMLTGVSPLHLLQELRAGVLAIVDFDLPDSVREVGFVLRKDAQPSGLSLLLMDEIRVALAASEPPFPRAGKQPLRAPGKPDTWAGW